MPGEPIVLVNSSPSMAEAEKFVARLWVCLEKHNVETPKLRLRFGFGVSVIAQFRDSAAAKVIIDELSTATL
jgi:hypothetical protein